MICMIYDALGYIPAGYELIDPAAQRPDEGGSMPTGGTGGSTSSGGSRRTGTTRRKSTGASSSSSSSAAGSNESADVTTNPQTSELPWWLILLAVGVGVALA